MTQNSLIAGYNYNCRMYVALIGSFGKLTLLGKKQLAIVAYRQACNHRNAMKAGMKLLRISLPPFLPI